MLVAMGGGHWLVLQRDWPGMVSVNGFGFRLPEFGSVIPSRCADRTAERSSPHNAKLRNVLCDTKSRAKNFGSYSSRVTDPFLHLIEIFERARRPVAVGQYSVRGTRPSLHAGNVCASSSLRAWTLRLPSVV